VGGGYVPVLGSGSLNHIPAYAGCHDSDRCILLLCVSIAYSTSPGVLISIRPLSCCSANLTYSGLNITALIMIYLWAPETKQRTLEELDYIFAVPTRRHMSYQVFESLPWWVKRYIFRQRVELEPLYTFEELAPTTEGESETPK
jgi:hypothetical protein